MKRALALLAISSVFGFAALAQQFTGSWDFSISLTYDRWDEIRVPSFDLIVPETDWDSQNFDRGVVELDIDFNSTLTINYTVGGWTFSGITTFGERGFQKQEFDADGAFGALTISSTMTFLAEYKYLTEYFLRDDRGNLIYPPICSPVEYYGGPYFEKWDVTASLSFAGMDLEFYFLLRPFTYNTETRWLVVDWDEVLAGYEPWGYLYISSSKDGGSGLRLKLSSTFNGATITSYTYFGMTEVDSQALNTGPCPVIGKSGVYYLSDECGFAFTEEYLTIEDLSFCCDTTFDLALKITCDGFEYLDILFEAPFLNWVTLAGMVQFTTTGKELSLCAKMPDLTFPCISIGAEINLDCYYELKEVVVYAGGDVQYTGWIIDENCHNDIPNYIDGIKVKNLTMTCEFSDCSSLTFKTVLGTLPKNALKTIDCWNQFVYNYWIDLDGDGVVDTDDGSGNDQDVDIFVSLCLPEAKWYAWESWTLELCGPGCCGGEYSVSITTYFGKGYEILGAYWELTTEDYVVQDGALELLGSPWKLIYGQELQLNTLFGWMATEFDAAIPISASFNLTVAGEVSFRGWEHFELGVQFTF